MSAMNLLDIEGYKAVILYDPEIEMFRGEFVALTITLCTAPKSSEELRREGKASLKVFLELCEEKGIEPRRAPLSADGAGLPAELHEHIAEAAER